MLSSFGSCSLHGFHMPPYDDGGLSLYPQYVEPGVPGRTNEVAATESMAFISMLKRVAWHNFKCEQISSQALYNVYS